MICGKKAAAQKPDCNKTIVRWFMHTVSTWGVRNSLKYKRNKAEESFGASPFSV
jgi:hypothetical protein